VAELHLQNALALESSDRSAFENLARLYYDRGRLRDASYLLLAELVVTQGQRVLEAEGRRSADLHNLHGLLLIERNNQVDALRAFKQAVEIEPDHADAHMNIAMIALRFRDYAQAERSIRVAIKDPRQQANVEAWLGLGVAHRGLRRYEEARAAFEQAAKLGSADPRALYNLGILHQEHIAPAQLAEDSGKRANQIARRYFSKVVERADRSEGVRATVADARKRMQSIDEYLEAIRVADELEKRAAEADRARAEEARRERERLLELEKRALESQSSSQS
jgi:Flp pilus assembly protein TadD